LSSGDRSSFTNTNERPTDGVFRVDANTKGNMTSGPWQDPLFPCQSRATFDASRVVPTGPENRMTNVGGVWCIRLANKVVMPALLSANGAIEKINQLQSKVSELEAIQNDAGTVLFEGDLGNTQTADILSYKQFREIEVFTTAVASSNNIKHILSKTLRVRNLNHTDRYLVASLAGNMGDANQSFSIWMDFITDAQVKVWVNRGPFWKSHAVTKIIGYK